MAPGILSVTRCNAPIVAEYLSFARGTDRWRRNSIADGALSVLISLGFKRLGADALANFVEYPVGSR